MTSAAHALTGRRVLLVEDDYFIAADMRRQFEASGVQVLGPVPTVARALALIAATPQIDAAVLDINLREEAAYPVADALQARGVPFVFATGYDSAVVPQRFAGVRHCQKPVEPLPLVQAILA